MRLPCLVAMSPVLLAISLGTASPALASTRSAPSTAPANVWSLGGAKVVLRSQPGSVSPSTVPAYQCAATYEAFAVAPSPAITQFGSGSCTAQMSEISIYVDTAEFGVDILPNADGIAYDTESSTQDSYPLCLDDLCAVGDEFLTEATIIFDISPSTGFFNSASGDCSIRNSGYQLYCYGSGVWYIE